MSQPEDITRYQFRFYDEEGQDYALDIKCFKRNVDGDTLLQPHTSGALDCPLNPQQLAELGLMLMAIASEVGDSGLDTGAMLNRLDQQDLRLPPFLEVLEWV